MSIIDYSILVQIFFWLFIGFFILFIYYMITRTNTKNNKQCTCPTCNIYLVRSQIKFGLCPKCAKKIPNVEECNNDDW